MLVVKKKILIISAVVLAVLIGVSVTAAVSGNAVSRSTPLGYTVAIDAGHGGIDAGVSGVNTSVKESELNLQIAQRLKAYFKMAGVDVVMTRNNSNGLYGLSTKNFKMRDMKERERIISEANPDLLVSLHQNFFSQSKQRGAQVFYKPGSEASEKLAGDVRRRLSQIEHCDRILLAGDYYVLNTCSKPAILIECGFLSNSEDEALLITPDYQEKLAYYIFLGSMNFLGAELPFFD